MKKLILISFLITNIIASEIYKLDRDKSNSYYRANSSFLFFSKDEIIGVNKNLRGELVVNEDSIKGNISINSGAFDTQNSKRDTHVREILNYKKYPNIKFKIENETINNSKTYLLGKLSINGVEKSIKLAVEKSIKSDEIFYKGKTSIKYRDFNISPPTLGFIKEAKESIEIGAKFFFRKEK